MTDITELAQQLKAAAEKATPGEWVYFPKNTSIEYDVGSDESQGSILYVDSGDFTQAQTDRNGEFIALANPANILALVEALETEKRICATWRKTAESTSEKLEKSEKTSEARREAIGRAHNMFVRERDRANAAEEALDKAQQVDEELCKLLPPGVEYMDPPDGGDVTPLEGVRRMVADYRQRIAELESRTVTVKPMRPGHITVGGEKIGIYMRDEVDEFIAALTAAGIKVEAE
ncbi:ead/Ea22-like family protein [Klebsiella pneumoniae]|uniref:ead/Ea22-like family protein n=1 Tax=Klebsiella pneumoniae TaxID=573 RepID=UPI002E80EFBE|nr:ead/Ea22-like family protein [Klebsiella pneumoniae]MEE2244747.1 ead/Ea22-like family protein [Klebsiella pneumoniae]